MKKMKILTVLPIVSVLLTGCVSKKTYPIVKYFVDVKWKNADEDFKILQLCDIHLSQSDNYEEHLKILHKTISKANPNLIVLNGDSFTYADKKVVNRLFLFIDSYDIPWTFAFGNHDDQGYYSDTYIEKLLAGDTFNNVKFIDFIDDDIPGRSNFCINIYQKASSSEPKKYKYQVYLLDSHSYNFDTLRYDFIKEEQVQWYEKMLEYSNENYKNGDNNIESVMYFHIATHEFYEAWEKYEANPDGGEVILVNDGFNEENMGGPEPESDSRLFNSVRDHGQTKAISCAHDHINNSVLLYQNVNLCFGVHSTNRIYYDPNKIGGQLIKINKDNQSLSFENIYVTYEEAK